MRKLRAKWREPHSLLQGWAAMAYTLFMSGLVTWAGVPGWWGFFIGIVWGLALTMNILLLRRRYAWRRTVWLKLDDGERRVVIPLDPKRMDRDNPLYAIAVGVRRGGSCRVDLERVEDSGGLRIVDWEFENPAEQPY